MPAPPPSHGESLKFLRAMTRQGPKGLEIHMILDNYGTHKHANVGVAGKAPHFHLHSTPTSSPG